MRRSSIPVGVVAASTAACSAQVVLNAHPGPANLGGGAGHAIFFDLEAVRGPVIVTELRIANTAFANGMFEFELLVRDGTGLGGSDTTGPGTSMVGWTSLGLVQGVQGPQTEGISLPVNIPDINVPPGTVRGVALWFSHWGPRVFEASIGGPYWEYQDAGLRLTTGDLRTRPFQTICCLFRPSLLVGSITYVIPNQCYPNCDGSTAPAALNVNDFVCFQTAFAAGHAYANCDQSTSVPVLNVLDFVCFMQRFAAGCQ